MILGICSQPEVLEVLNLIKIIIGGICIVVPIVLIVFISKDYMKSISDSDALTNVHRSLITRAIAAIVIFMIPTFIRVILYVADYAGADVYDCLDKANAVDISIAYSNRAEKYVDNAKKSLNRADYTNAEIAISKVDDNAKKSSLSNELKSIEKYIIIGEDIDSLKNKADYQKIKDIQSKIDNVNDNEIKQALQTKFDEVKNSVFASVGNYPIVPFGEHELYTGLKVYQGDSLDNLLKRNGSSASELDEKIKMAVEYYGVGTRKAAVAAVITLIGSVAETGYQLPYFWGGKWAKIGVNPNWGTRKDAASCNEYYFDTQEEIDSCKNRNKYWAMDCSGLVNWTVIQGIQKVKSQQDTNYGKRIKLESNRAVCQIGDALETEGHITIIVALDDENKRYIIAEESSGLEIDSIPYSGKKGNGYWCNKIDDYID